ncbi:MAG: bifunctional 23S rRNA (guanine(2069)-N(7))-methyltransferase RlmK/23S rRNA (guanine(2445)-N(2))-methyltransferase RlmL [Spirochaetes bacterium]|nr:bifunctional 23S rRNA (guanine(2069)-N(7))-methyltransferase RlmK/23S rRNA (guanine(2445)-N(2))-methyltransferase RlmL [Spirochaetota bacterium]
MAKSYRFFVTCASGFEHQLNKELKNIKPALALVQKQGGVEFTGSFSDGLRICLWSRIAGKVLLALEDFNPKDENEIYERAKRIKWSDFFLKNKTIAVDTTLLSRAFTNSSYLSLLVKDGISDHFRAVSGSRPTVDKQDADIRINLFVAKNSATISLDISGGSLHERGYRRKGAVAPLKENLAAALLERAGWPLCLGENNKTPPRNETDDKPAFVDPMCGSGTFLIEAALIASNTAPGLLRKNFSFQHLRQFKPEEWKALIEEAYQARSLESLLPVRIFGFDIDADAIKISKENIKAAGLSSYISVKKCDITNIENQLDKNLIPGLVAVNLPYGKRLGSEDELPELYQMAGEKIKENFEGFKVLTLSGDEELSRNLGMKALQVNTVYNGSIKSVSGIFSIDSRYRDCNRREACALSSDGDEVPLYAAKERRSSKGKNNFDENEEAGVSSDYFSEMLANRLKKNIKALKKWKTKENISCYRIYDADIPEYSASIDIYSTRISDQHSRAAAPDATSVLQFLFIQEYAAPAEIPAEKAEHRLKEIIYTAQNVTGIYYKNINVRQKKRQKRGDQYKKRADEGVFEIIQEEGLSFYVNFHDYLDTGIFLDHRIARKMIRELADGKKMLNLFAYTATASVYAAAGGALATTSVDANSAYCDWAEKNFVLNKMSLRTNQIIKADCMEFLENNRELYDIIFIDPPTFSNSKSREGFFDIQRDHAGLLTLAAEKLTKDGIIIFSSNFKKFKLDDSINKLFCTSNITEQTVSPDFERHGYSRQCWTIKKYK